MISGYAPDPNVHKPAFMAYSSINLGLCSTPVPGPYSSALEQKGWLVGASFQELTNKLSYQLKPYTEEGAEPGSFCGGAQRVTMNGDVVTADVGQSVYGE